MNITKSGTIISDENKIVHFGINDFIQKICEEDNCFLCGAQKDEKLFNDEHIIPKWILRKYKLFNKFVTLPNKMIYRYDKYTIPCCSECNSLLGSKIEDPICDAFSKDYDYFKTFLSKNGQLLFIWLALIFLKTHLKDRQFKEKLREKELISDTYDWETLHHIHCIVRTIYTNATVDEKAFGSIVVLPAMDSSPFERFDYGDLYYGKTVFVRLGNIAVLSVLNDSCICMNLNKSVLKKIAGALNPLQLRELVVKFAYCNILIKNRPVHYTSVDKINKEITIEAKLPKILEIVEYNREEYGMMLFGFIHQCLDSYKSKDRDWEIRHLKAGDLSYLFNEKGEFNKDSIVITDSEGNRVS